MQRDTTLPACDLERLALDGDIGLLTWEACRFTLRWPWNDSSPITGF